MTGPQFVPDSFMKSLLGEFGLTWTQLAIVAGVGVSTFGLEAYIAGGPWIFGAIGGLVVSLVLDRSFKPPFRRVLAVVLVIAAVAAGAIVAYTAVENFALRDHLKSFRVFYSTVLGAVSAAVSGLLLLPYRREEHERGRAEVTLFPPEIQSEIEKLQNSALHRSSHEVALRFTDLDANGVNLETEVRYRLVNRTGGAETVSCGLTGKDAQRIDCTYARVGDDRLDTDDVELNTNIGFTVAVTVEPHEEVECVFRGVQRCYLRDSAVYTSYLPATSFELTIDNPYEDEMRVIITQWGPERLEKVVGAETESWRAPGACLPYTGARIHWVPIATT